MRDRQSTPDTKSQHSQPTKEREAQRATAQEEVLATQQDPLVQTISRIGSAPSAKVHADLLSRATSDYPARGRQLMLQMQRQYGNRYVQRVMELSRQGGGEAEATPEVEAAIEQARGGGRSLDSGIQRQMESAFGTNFSGVRVHTDSTADALNQSLSARAFTTGQDIFFRQGEYNPGSSSGKELLAHELTHVVQQTGGIQSKLAVGEPGDQYEQEADRVANAVVQMLKTVSSQSTEVSSCTPIIQRACSGCREEEQMTHLLETQSLEETDEGTETLTTQSLAINSGMPLIARNGGPVSTNYCALTGSFTTIPSGTVAATLSGNKLGAPFSMVGTFSVPIPCICSAGEYRQYVRGSFTRNGSNVTHALCGTNLHPTTFQEDCGIFGGNTYKYGYRSIPFANSRFTSPDQATGCQFNGFDHPGITGSSGDTLSVNLDFRGELIDTGSGGAVLASSSWSVVGSATVP